MTPHSVLFNTIVDREDDSRTISPPLGMQPSSPSSTSSSLLRTPNAYWGTDHSIATGRGRDYPYSQYRTEIDVSLPNPTRSPNDHYGHHQSDSSNPTIDFSGLIPMYAEPDSPDMDPRNHLMDLSYENDQWPTSNMAQYATFQRNKPLLWQPSADGHLPPQKWNTSLNGSLTQHFHEYVPYPTPSSHSSSTSSSPSSSYLPTPSSTSDISSRTLGSRRGAADQGTPKKSCFHCHVTTTPLWRREPLTQRPLCNACGLYLQQRNKLRPQELIDADIEDDTPQIPDEEYTGPKCSHCNTRQTSVWRRSKTGAQVCNACGVYARLRGKERPLSLRRNKIKPRTKHSR
ncbi:hypothetical protein C8R44DRAFT_885087 [Mycena epipterygia]|nr:hypothetical protein C8R44DRAFT_885087 [Mycena epipterygia]